MNSTYEEANDTKEWQQAMEEEYKALEDNTTWNLVPRQEGMKVIGNKWVYKVKRNSDGSIARYKEMLMAKRFAQSYGVDYEATFNLVAKMTIISTIIGVATSRKWPIYQLHVKNVFLNRDLQETIYMTQPLGFENPKYSIFVCKFRKALYGLK